MWRERILLHCLVDYDKIMAETALKVIYRNLHFHSILNLIDKYNVLKYVLKKRCPNYGTEHNVYSEPS